MVRCTNCGAGVENKGYSMKEEDKASPWLWIHDGRSSYCNRCWNKIVCHVRNGYGVEKKKSKLSSITSIISFSHHDVRLFCFFSTHNEINFSLLFSPFLFNFLFKLGFWMKQLQQRKRMLLKTNNKIKCL